MFNPVVASGRPIPADLVRQQQHWLRAVRRLSALDDMASPVGWSSLEAYLGLSLRRTLGDTLGRLESGLRATMRPGADPEVLARDLHGFRRSFLEVESVVEFFVDAVNTRSAPGLAAQLAACDWLAADAMAKALVPLGIPRPPVLVYVDKGLGAAILKAGLRLWDGKSVNPVAMVRLARHNLASCTALFHECGHQVAGLTGWHPEVRRLLEDELPADVRLPWSNWASEIVADAFAFVHTGYASVLALTNVVDGGPEVVLDHRPEDVHPVPYLRVLLGVAMCRMAFGQGPWDAFANEWVQRYPMSQAASATRELIERSLPLLERIAGRVLAAPVGSFGGRSLSQLIDPANVSPVALGALERAAGDSLLTSPYWLSEGVRIVALLGLRAGLEPSRASEHLLRQEEWLRRAGPRLQSLAHHIE